MTRWAPIPGLAYEASTAGEVRHVERGVALTPRPSAWGRPIVSVAIGYDAERGRTISRALSVALAVLLAHRGPRPYPTALPAYRDGDPRNVRLGNLYWGTRAHHFEAFPRPRGETHPHHGKRLVGGVWTAK